MTIILAQSGKVEVVSVEILVAVGAVVGEGVVEVLGVEAAAAAAEVEAEEAQG